VGVDEGMREKLNFIDLFAGCGGLSLGLINAGLHGIFAIEKSPDAFSTLKYNLINGDKVDQFSWPSWLPCEAMTLSKLLKKYNQQLNELTGQIDLIAGGPPCQGFSLAGKRNPKDIRNKLTGEYVKVVGIIRPKYILLENVKGFKASFSSKRKNKVYAEIVKTKLENIGYAVYTFMIDASIFGVPQSRLRFIMVAIDKNIEYSENPYKVITSMARSFRKNKNLPETGFVSVSNAISNLQTCNGKHIEESSEKKGYMQIKYRREWNSKYQKLMQSDCSHDYTPNGLRLAKHGDEIIARFKNILKNYEKGKSIPKDKLEELGTKKFSFTPLHPNKLSRTITTLPDDLLHYSEPRILTVRENARLQSFPDWFEIKGKYTTGGKRRKHDCPKYTVVGNAVPPLLAEALGLFIFTISEAA
jgi:DNA (cytosine-5)-methyltransferase 1